jgi:transcriptional regulator with XRE-family HTH domain
MPSGPWSARQAARLSGRLRELRERRSWSFRDLAHASGLSPSTVRNLERGSQPDLGTMLALQVAYQLSSIEELLGPVPPSFEFLEPHSLGVAHGSGS